MQNRKITLMLAPALTVIGGLFFGGLLLGVVQSFAQGFAAYRAVFADPAFLAALGLSLYIATVATGISAILALGAALLLRRSFAGRRVALFLFQLNLTVPHLVGAIGILYLLSQSGIFARLGFAAGMIDKPADFPALIYDPYAIGIIVQYVWKEIPFITMILLANLQSLGADFESVARSHGASRFQALCFVILPMLRPALMRACVIVFVFGFGAYEIPMILGQNYPAALPVLAYRAFTDVDLATRPEALAMGVVIAALSGAIVALWWRR